MALKVPYGEQDGHLVHVDMVPRGLACNCICPVCRGTLIARQGETNAHHFAHHQDDNCDGETLLHYLGKHLLCSRISLAISRREGILFSWRCRECEDVHQGDLIEEASSVRLEESLGNIQPDVTLFDQHRRPLVLVEVVVTHESEQSVWAYARDNETDLVIFRITENDLEHLERGTPLIPSMALVARCNRPKCSACGRPQRRRSLYVMDIACVNCSHSARQSIVKTDTPLLQFYGPEGFNDSEIAIAEQAGVQLRLQQSNYFGFTYLANTCPECEKPSSHLYSYEGVWPQLFGESPASDEGFCLNCESRPDNISPQTLSQECITWNCDTEREIGKVVCSRHLQSYLTGSQPIPFMGFSP